MDDSNREHDRQAVIAASHPAGVAKDGLWFGPEVEGTLTGAPTVFISRKLTDDELSRVLNAEKLGHIFLTERFDEWEWFEHTLLPNVMAGCYACTVGRMPHQVDAALSLPYSEHLGLIVRVFDAPWVHKLRAHDQVSVGVPYHLRTWRADNGVLTAPNQYEQDEA